MNTPTAAYSSSRMSSSHDRQNFASSNSAPSNPLNMINAYTNVIAI